METAKTRLAALLISAVVLLQCIPDRAVPAQPFIIFEVGGFACECGGHCSTSFVLENQQLVRIRYEWCQFESEIDRLDMPEEKRALVNNLALAVPKRLFSSQQVIGQPDAGDWGGYRIRIVTGDQYRVWFIDTMEDNLPNWIKPFQRRIRQTLREL